MPVCPSFQVTACEKMASSCTSRGGLDQIRRKFCSLKGWTDTLSGVERVAQGSDRIAIPRNVQKACGCCTWRFGLLVNTTVLG